MTLSDKKLGFAKAPFATPDVLLDFVKNACICYNNARNKYYAFLLPEFNLTHKVDDS
jgi:hypothetical protein